MRLGERIRFFRMQKQMTQEELAKELNISFQAVSKWERNESLPDVTLVARLAEVLHTTCDALLSDTHCLADSEIDALIQEASALKIEDHTQYMQRIELLENALVKYPHSVRLMLALADSYSKGGEYPEYREKNYLMKAISIWEYAAVYTEDIRQKYQITEKLCYVYRALEKYDRIRELAEKMPEIYQTRPALLHHSMPGKQQLEGIHMYCRELLDMTECCLNLLIYPNMEKQVQEHLNSLRDIADTMELWNMQRYVQG